MPIVYDEIGTKDIKYPKPCGVQSGRLVRLGPPDFWLIHPSLNGHASPARMTTRRPTLRAYGLGSC
jgi:hypothetical protein